MSRFEPSHDEMGEMGACCMQGRLWRVGLSFLFFGLALGQSPGGCSLPPQRTPLFGRPSCPPI